MEPQKTHNYQRNPEGNEQNWRHNSPQKQTNGSMEQNRQPQNKPTHLWSINVEQRRQEYAIKTRQSFQQVVWESWTTAQKSMKLEYTRTLHTKINSKWLKALTIRHDTIKLLEHRQNISDINHSNIFLGQFPKAKEIKEN